MSSLFDLSFKSFITPKIIQVIFIVGLIVVSIAALVFLVGSIASGSAITILFGLIGAVVIVATGIIYVRVINELLILQFRIRDVLEQIAINTGGATPPRPAQTGFGGFGSPSSQPPGGYQSPANPGYPPQQQPSQQPPQQQPPAQPGWGQPPSS
ncbi:hypothetical protein BH23ACT9_BH23ACT9_39640 [soil metagenome]